MNYDCAWGSGTFVTSIPDFTTANVTLANGNSIKVVTGWKDTIKRSSISFIKKAT